MRKLYFRKAYKDKYTEFISFSTKSKYWNLLNSYDQHTKNLLGYKFNDGKLDFLIQEAYYKYIWKIL